MNANKFDSSLCRETWNSNSSYVHLPVRKLGYPYSLYTHSQETQLYTSKDTLEKIILLFFMIFDPKTCLNGNMLTLRLLLAIHPRKHFLTP